MSKWQEFTAPAAATATLINPCFSTAQQLPLRRNA
jgi:hypothetical protein